MNSPEMLCTHGSENPDEFFGSVVYPIFQNSLFVEPKGDYNNPVRYSYSRGGNPTVEVVEHKIAQLEHGEAALCFSSGMGAISATLLHVSSHTSHIVCATNVYGGTHALLDQILTRFGTEVTYVNSTDIAAFEEAITEHTSAIYIESPSYCLLECIDIKALAHIASNRKIITIIDNTYASPIFQNPIDYGIDIVIHSVSKYLGGHSDLVGGVVISNKTIIDALRMHERNLLGNHMDPHTASLLLRGIRTLPLRMQKFHDTIIPVVQFLLHHPFVKEVFHPSIHPTLATETLKVYGSLVSFVTTLSQDEILSWVQSLNIIRKGPSWGGFESLVMPFSASVADMERMGIPKGLIRISVGLEGSEEIIADLQQAFEQVTQRRREM